MAKIFATDNSVVAMKRRGICNGLTAAWAETSLKYGRCTADHQAAIQQSGLLLAARSRLNLTGLGSVDTGAQWGNMMFACGLRFSYMPSGTFISADALGQYMANLVNRTICLVISYPKAEGGMGCHAMGARITATECDFFDPNYGLERLESPVEFRIFVDAILFISNINVAASQVHIWTLTSTH